MCRWARDRQRLAGAAGPQGRRQGHRRRRQRSSPAPGHATPAPVEPAVAPTPGAPLLLLRSSTAKPGDPAPSPTAPKPANGASGSNTDQLLHRPSDFSTACHHHHPGRQRGAVQACPRRFRRSRRRRSSSPPCSRAPTPPPSRIRRRADRGAGQRRAAHDLHGSKSANDGSYSLTVTFDVGTDQTSRRWTCRTRSPSPSASCRSRCCSRASPGPSASRRSCWRCRSVGRPALRLPVCPTPDARQGVYDVARRQVDGR